MNKMTRRGEGLEGKPSLSSLVFLFQQTETSVRKITHFLYCLLKVSVAFPVHFVPSVFKSIAMAWKVWSPPLHQLSSSTFSRKDHTSLGFFIIFFSFYDFYTIAGSCTLYHEYCSTLSTYLMYTYRNVFMDLLSSILFVLYKCIVDVCSLLFFYIYIYTLC